MKITQAEEYYTMHKAQLQMKLFYQKNSRSEFHI
ncbi:hypothetical protein FHS15_000778 [Paenibacillus castaneae]|nr:hypothetical protein [Paenibacillus castaneae]